MRSTGWAHCGGELIVQPTHRQQNRVSFSSAPVVLFSALSIPSYPFLGRRCWEQGHIRVLSHILDSKPLRYRVHRCGRMVYEAHRC